MGSFVALFLSCVCDPHHLQSLLSGGGVVSVVVCGVVLVVCVTRLSVTSVTNTTVSKREIERRANRGQRG